jgi:hypothetical protein
LQTSVTVSVSVPVFVLVSLCPYIGSCVRIVQDASWSDTYGHDCMWCSTLPTTFLPSIIKIAHVPPHPKSNFALRTPPLDSCVITAKGRGSQGAGVCVIGGQQRAVHVLVWIYIVYFSKHISSTPNSFIFHRQKQAIYIDSQMAPLKPTGNY